MPLCLILMSCFHLQTTSFIIVAAISAVWSSNSLLMDERISTVPGVKANTNILHFSITNAEAVTGHL